MIDFLRFTLYAPLASWGDTAIGEIRGSWDRPSRSAILGLIAAALGITRDDDATHERLDSSIGVAVRSLAAGDPLVDYHTTQNPEARIVAKHRPATRRTALSLSGTLTALSRRWLLQDSLFLLAIWNRPRAAIALSAIKDALAAPVFTLYAGRKANVLGLPLAPELVNAQTLAKALLDPPTLPADFSLLGRRGEWGTEVAHDICERFESGLVSSRSLARRDDAPVRSRWQFSERTMFIGRIPGESLR